MTRESRPALGMILKGYPRISESFISNEIRLLEELGFKIRIFSMRHPRESFTHASVKAIRAEADYLPEEILPHIARLLKANVLLAFSRPGPYRKALFLAFRRWLRTRKSATVKHLLQAGYLVQRLLPGRNIGHLHAHFAHSPASVTLFASILSGLSFSFTAHAKDIYTSDPRQIAEKIRMARYVVTCTAYNRRHLLGLVSQSRTPIFTVHHGSDLSLFQMSSRPRINPQPPYRILTVARLTPKKGLPTVYRALRHLADRGVDFRHTLIGEGEDREVVSNLVRDLHLETMTECLGTQPHEKVLEIFRQSDLFALGCQVATDGDRDGIPNVLVESLAMGVPVVATRVSALPELIIDGQTGLLVPPENPEAMSDAMQRILTDEKLREEIIEQGRNHVVRCFDNRLHIAKLARIHQELGIRMQYGF